MWPWRLGYSGAVVPVEVIHLPAPRTHSRRSRAPLRYSYRSRRRAVLRACDDVCWYVSMFRWIQDETRIPRTYCARLSDLEKALLQ